MNEADIENAIGKHLSDAALGYDIAWPNRDVAAGQARPYLVFQMVRTGRTSPVLKGGAAKVYSDGFAMISVVAQTDKFATAANRIADTVAALVPAGQQIAVTGGGTMTISKPAEILQGYPDDVNWRVPVRVTYRARA